MRMPAVSVPTHETAARQNWEQWDSPTSSATLERRHYHKSEIAALSLCDITELPREDLIAIIKSVPTAFAQTQEADRLSERLDFLNRKTLERLAFIARRCCRNQGY